MEFIETENKKKSLGVTSLLFMLFFLILFYAKFSNVIQLPLLEEGGGGGGEVAVNFGDSDVGMGDNFQSVEKVTAASKPVVAEQADEKEIVVSENDDAPAIIKVKKPTEKPKKVLVEKVVIKTPPKPSKSTNDALSSILNGSSSSGDGDDKTGGNKGKSNGDKNASGYNGGGGSGTGSGGGNGSGTGIGSGSGYGSGSGSGTGSGNGNYQLGNRKASKPQPSYTCDEQGTVVVQISVDKSGRVTSANPGVRGTTNSAKCLLDQAKIAAMSTKWQSSDDAPEKQVGKIVYSFKLTE
jgi:hypothetical protein